MFIHTSLERRLNVHTNVYAGGRHRVNVGKRLVRMTQPRFILVGARCTMADLYAHTYYLACSVTMGDTRVL